MPYEQYMGQATPSSDLYATAATFLHLLTGRAPREFMTDEGRIEVPESLPGEQRLRPVIARLLRPSPAERFASARDVRNALVGAPESRAVVKRGATSGLQKLSKTVELVHALPPAPRELSGDTKKLMQDSTFDTVRVMTASTKSLEDWGVFDVVTLVFFSVITAGIMPLIFFSIANARRRRMKRFFRDGHPGVAEISRIELETTAFDEKLARVSYQFQVDGEPHRDSDVVLPTIADRLQPGDRVPILYLPDRDYDSVIVAVE
jgi:serine/threonine protein kinase